MKKEIEGKPREDLLLMGEAVCRDRDWRGVAIWAYNVHRLFRGVMQRRKVWDDLDSLICRECDWHIGRDLFQAIRQISLNLEKGQPHKTEYAYLRLGEITAKCISNASWSPGLFDFDAPWHVPALAFEICEHLHDERQAEFLHNHFTSLAKNRYMDKPTRG
jgi:hypothetical protein